MQTSQVENEITYQEIFNRAFALISRSEKAKKDLIIANFQLGGLVAEIQDNASYGDSAVLKLAEDLSKAKGYQIHASFLWECARVYRTFKGNLQRVWELEKELQLRGIQISWRFLVRNCTPMPEPEKVFEAEAYWEQKITEWENSVNEIEEKIEKKDELLEKMPPKSQEQFQGFVARLNNDSVKVSSERRFEDILVKLEKALDLLKNDNELRLNNKSIVLLKRLKEKIEQILYRYNGSL